MCEHKGSSPSPGAPRLAPKRLRVAGTALWIPTESSDPAEPWGGGGDEGASDCVTRGCPVPRRVGDEAGGGCALSLGKQGHHCPLGSGSLDPHFLPLRTAVLPPGGCRGRAPPQKPRERARFFAPPPQGESNTEPPPTQGGGTRAHPRLPSLSLDPPRRQGSELPPPSPARSAAKASLRPQPPGPRPLPAPSCPARPRWVLAAGRGEPGPPPSLPLPGPPPGRGGLTRGPGPGLPGLGAPEPAAAAAALVGRGSAFAAAAAVRGGWGAASRDRGASFPARSPFTAEPELEPRARRRPPLGRLPQQVPEAGALRPILQVG